MTRNPITYRKLRFKPGSLTAARERSVESIVHGFPEISYENAVLLASNLGWPTKYLAEGAKAIVFAHPTRPDRIIKITSDGGDAAAFAYLLELNNPTNATPEAYDVKEFNFPFSSDEVEGEEQPGKLWVIELERVAPINRAERTCLVEARIIMDELAGNDVMTVVQDEIVDCHIQNKPIPRKLQQRAVQAMRWMTKQLKEEATTSVRLVAIALEKCARTVSELLRLGIITVDLAARNWGIRELDDGYDMVVYDLGFSGSGNDERPRSMTVYGD